MGSEALVMGSQALVMGSQALVMGSQALVNVQPDASTNQTKVRYDNYRTIHLA